MPKRAAEPVVHSITGAVAPHSDDIDARIKRYLISMVMRSVCVVLVIVIDSPVRWVFAVLAVILPGVAVVMANAAGNRVRQGVPPVTPTEVSQVSLLPGQAPLKGETTRNAPYERGTEESAERTP